MDELTSKKWYVYLGNRHEGPFSVEDISTQLGQGKLTQQTYVWAEGMTEWQPMVALKDFQLVFTPPLKPPGLETVLPTRTAQAGDALLLTNHLDTSFEIKEESSPVKKPNKVRKFPMGFIVLGMGIILAVILFRMTNLKLNGSMLAETGAALQELSRPYLLSLTRQFPKLEGWFSPLPAIDSIPPSDYEELKAAAQANPSLGPKFGLAASQADNLPPVLYLASNLPDGTPFKIYVVGSPHTLLNHLSFSNSLETTLHQRLGQTPPLRFPDGKPIPKGEYTLYLVPGEHQSEASKNLLDPLVSLLEVNPPELPKNAKVIATKKYFLGGKRDTAYQARLKDYHNKLKARAEAEITDVKQFLVTLANQLEETSTEYEKLAKGTITAKKRQQWQTFHTHWSGFQTQLSGIFQKWTPDTIRDQYFFGQLFIATAQLGSAIDKLHSYQNSLFVEEHRDSKELEIPLGEAKSSAETLLQSLKAKIGQAEKLPTSADGMPLRPEEAENPTGK